MQDLIVFALILVLGCTACFFGVFYAIFRLIEWSGRGIVGLLRPNRIAHTGLRIGSGRSAGLCPRPQCRKVEVRAARFCSQCGGPMIEADRADSQ